MGVKEFDLPDGILQHIQRFLDTKEAARTAILSKSWFSAWSTRPSLHFNYRNLSTARQTVERYLRLNLKLERFELGLIADWGDYDAYASLVYELILDVLKLGMNDLHLCLDFMYPMYVLPVQVIAAAPLSLEKLYVSHCKIDGLTQDSVICCRLTSLTLVRVCSDDAMIKIVLSGCHLLEILQLIDCTGMTKIDLSKMINLKSVRLWSERQPLWVQFTDSGSDIGGGVKEPEFVQLSSLELTEVGIGDEFFHDYLRKFPSLQCLILSDCDGFENVQISSSSLQLLRLKNKQLKKAQFDVPNIQKFEYSGSDVPSLSFSTSSEEWESCVTFNVENYDYGNGASWFLNLRKFLMNLSPSRISLCVEGFHDAIPMEYVLNFPIPVVENLAIYGSPSQEFFRGLFWSCHPKYVAPKTSLFEYLQHDENLRLRHYKDLHLLHDVLTTVHVPDDVTVEFKYGTCTEWQPIPWIAVFEAWTSAENKETVRVRFKLKWQGTF